MRALFIIYLILAPFGAEARTLLENHHVKVGFSYGRHAHLPPPSPASSPPTRDVSSVFGTRTDQKISSQNTELFKKLFVSYLVSYVWNLIASSSCHDLSDIPDTKSDEKYWRRRPHQSPPSPRPSDRTRPIIIDSNCHDLSDIPDTKFDEKHSRRRPHRSPPSPRPSDRTGPIIINSNCHDLLDIPEMKSDEKYSRRRPHRSPPSPRPSDRTRPIIIDSNFHDHNNNNYGREGGRLAPPAAKYDPPIHQVTSKGGAQGLKGSLSSPYLAST
ncbi:uncharacterized protein LOC132603621 [Lycium barbarum]|uniref:uncharacterized protein LOC132603621 n=1 Tax=Lycium barbarum TaxID=112863 RepID=UPI00293E2668|nr:uncharacterized protein LOC132603621 [Lycium barbarum]